MIIFSADTITTNEEINAQTVSFTLNTDLKTVIKSAKLYLNDTVVATATNSDVNTAGTIITFDNISNLNFPTTTSELKLAIVTENIGFELVGTAVSNVSVTNVSIYDAQGLDSAEIITISDLTTTASNTFDVVPTIVTNSVSNIFGNIDNNAGITFMVDSGSNTESSGNQINTELFSLELAVSSVTSTGTIILKNGNAETVATADINNQGPITLNSII